MTFKTIHFLSAYLKARYFNRFDSREHLEAWQNQKVLTHLKKIIPMSPFYQKHFRGLPLEEWKNFPVIDKTIMMENFDGLNTAKISKDTAFTLASQAEQTRDFSATLDDITIGLSTGTSGNRGLFAVSQKEQALWAGAFLAKILPGSPLRQHRLSLFLRANSNLYTSTRRRTIQFEFFDLLTPIREHIPRLNSYKPTLLLAPPSMLRLLAEAKEQKSLKIEPEKIVSVAEVLDLLDEQFIQKQFRQIVHQVYQCTEGFLGCTCSYGRVHLNEDMAVIQKEYIDGSKSKFMPIITDFKRTVQPIIRYRLNDILSAAQAPCACGSKFIALEMIEGRCDDIFYFPGENGDWTEVFPDFIRRAILAASHEIKDYACIQKSPTLMHVHLKVDEKVSSSVKHNIRNNFLLLSIKLRCKAPEIVFSPEIPLNEEKKLRKIKRAFTR